MNDEKSVSSDSTGNSRARRQSGQSAATALAMNEAAHDPSVGAEAANFLREQLALTKLQVEHFDAEHRHTIDGTRISRALEAMKLVMQGAITLVLIGAATLLASMIWSASRDHSLVIERFAVPPDLAEHQINGEQLAGLVADKLATLTAQSASFRADATFQTDWGNDINIEVPGAGISLGEVDRLLRTRIGHQTRIGGTLYHEGSDLRLSLRAGSGEAANVAGTANDIDALAQKAAEAITAQTQPYRYSKYLEFAGRTDEAMAVARKLAATGPVEEQAWAWAQISNLLSKVDVLAARAAGYRAIRLNPDLALAWLNTSNCEALLGHAQTSLDLVSKSVELSSHGGGGLSEIGISTGGVLNRGFVALSRGDPGAAATIFRQRNVLIYHNLAGVLPTNLSAALAALHDISGSARVPDVTSDAGAISVLYINDTYLAPAYARATNLDDWPAALAAAQSQLDALAKQPEGPELARLARERFVLPHLAWALVELGRRDEARAIAATLPTDCYQCLRTRAWVMGRTGDMATANRDFAAAIASNPRLVFADLEWGRLLLLRGDISKAEAHLRRATELAPNFADPRKYLGDTLFAERRFKEAATNYAAAAQYAPRWGSNQIMWGKALWLTGKRDEARAKFAAAKGMDLSAADHAALDRLSQA